MRRLPGSHPPNIKNRSSKQYNGLTGIKPVFKSMSNEVLSRMSLEAAARELRRREKKRSSRDSK